MNQNKYYFNSVWIVPCNVKTAETAILDMHSWTKWWAGVTEAKVIDPKISIIGTKISATWKSMFGYRLRTRLTITGYKEGEYVTFQSEGDLVGQGSWSFRPALPGKTQMEITWSVTTKKPWMNIFGLFLRPLFVYAHGKLMKSGESGLRQYIIANK